MRVTILSVGKLKEDWQRAACQEYLKRLSRYGRFEMEEVPDEPEAQNSSDALREKIREKEGRALLGRVRPDDFVAALAIEGAQSDSVAFSHLLDGWGESGKRVVLLIGGSLGLSREVIRRADYLLSFSKLTFPHPLMRVILLEQLYRARKISAGERYHK